MISMDTHSHVDGPSKVHTIKRYLSDLKEEGAVNTSSVRCRELDCLRAYYYMTILHFLKERCNAADAALQETERKEGNVVKVQSEAGEQGSRSAAENSGTSVDGESNKLDQNRSVQKLQSVIEKASEESSVVTVEPVEQVQFDLDSKSEEPKSDSGGVEGSSDKVVSASTGTPDGHEGDTNLQDEGTNVDPFVGGSEKQSDVKSETDSKDQKNEKPVLKSEQRNGKLLPKPNSITKLEDLFGPLLEVPKLDIVRPKENKHSSMVSQMNMNHFSITITKLVHLSQGLLWDLQAKRYALTETLGYIHKAISQLLLSKKPKPSIVDDTIGAERSVVRQMADGTDLQTESGSSEREQSSSSKTDSHSSNANQTTGVPDELSGASGEIGATGTSGGHDHQHEHEHHAGHHLCPHHSHHGHICQTSLSLHFEHMINIHVPHAGEMSVPEPETEPEFNSSFFEVCASCELIQKSRKILWEDEPHFLGRSEGGFKDMTNIINPAKYINVPDEWYNMPVDQKYFKPYVTMAILKDEQEYVMHELKRGPDSTQVRCFL